MPPGVVDVRRPIGVEIGFDVLRDGQAAVPEDQGARPGGRDRVQRDGHRRAVARADTRRATYVATAWIPGNFLNEGSAIVEAAICSLDFPKLEHHAAVYEAVSFEVLDPGEGDSARGQFSGQWRGVVRPMLEWTYERRRGRPTGALRVVTTGAGPVPVASERGRRPRSDRRWCRPARPAGLRRSARRRWRRDDGRVARPPGGALDGASSHGSAADVAPSAATGPGIRGLSLRRRADPTHFVAAIRAATCGRLLAST